MTQYVTHDIPGSLLCIFMAILAIPIAKHLKHPATLICFIARRSSIISVILLIILGAGTHFVYHNHPLTVDEFAPFFQARIFAEGRLYGLFPPGLGNFLTPGSLVISPLTGEVHSQYLPGFALLLTPFIKIGAPWLLNPLIGVGILLAIRHLALRLHGDELAAGWAMLLTLASPAFTINAISYYALNAQLLGCLVFTALLIEDTPRSMLAAGAVLGFTLVLHQPPRPLLYSIPWIVWIGFRAGRTRNLTAIAAGALPFVFVLGLGWYQLSAVDAKPDSIQIGQHQPKSFVDVITITLQGVLNIDSLAQIGNRWLGLNKFITWSTPALPLLALLGWQRSRHRQHIILLALSLVTTFIGYLFIRADQGHGWGFRYLQATWGALPLLAAGILANATSRENPVRIKEVPLVSYIAVLTLLSLVMGNGLQAWITERFIAQHLEQLPPLEPGKPQIVLIRPWSGYYSGDLIQNDPFLRNSTIYLHSPTLFVEHAIVGHYFPNATARMREMFDPVWILPEPPEWTPTLGPVTHWPTRLTTPPKIAQ